MAAAAWIFAGGAHHTSFSYAITAEHLSDFTAMAGSSFWREGQDSNTIPFLGTRGGKQKHALADVFFLAGRAGFE